MSRIVSRADMLVLKKDNSKLGVDVRRGKAERHRFEKRTFSYNGIRERILLSRTLIGCLLKRAGG